MKQPPGFVTSDPTLVYKVKRLSMDSNKPLGLGMRSYIKHYSSLGSLQANSTTQSSSINNKVLHFGLC